MNRPQYVNLTCPHCGHQWQEPTHTLLAARTIIYRDAHDGDDKGDDKTVARLVACPNCGKDVRVSVPKEWLDHE